MKILEGKEPNLSSNESNACQKLKYHLESKTPKYLPSNPNDDYFATQMLKNKRAKCDGYSSYVDCKFLEPTTNRREGLLSSPGMCYNKLRQVMTPEHIEEQLLLKTLEDVLNDLG